MLVTFLKKPTHSPKPKSTYPFSFNFQIPEIRSPRSCSYKKKEKRTLVTFSKKPTYPPELRIYIPLFPFPRDPEAKSRFYKKKKRKNINNILFQKKLPSPNLLSKILRSWILQRRGRKKRKERGRRRGREGKGERVREGKSERE